MATRSQTYAIRLAVEGAGQVKAELVSVGQSRDQSGNLRSSEDLLADVAYAFARIGDPAQRVRLAFKLFDSEGVALVNLLRGGSDALKAMRERARDLGIVLDEALVRDAERARTELDTLSHVISANLTRAALEAAPMLADLSSWLADVAGKTGIAWERLFDAPEEKSLRTLRYESTIAKLEGSDSGAAGLPDARLYHLPRHGADQRAGDQARRAAARPRSDLGADRIPKRAAGHRGAGSNISAPSRRHRGRAGEGQRPGADRARARGHPPRPLDRHRRGHLPDGLASMAFCLSKLSLDRLLGVHSPT
jgi:hypothetical protein